MIDLRLLVSGAKQVQGNLAVKQKQINGRHDKAAQAAARVYARYVRRALPRERSARKGAPPPGTLRKHVKVYAVAPGAFKVKVTGHVAHLVLGDIAEHAEAPATKRALSFSGGAYARVMHPAHHGDASILSRVRVEREVEARLAAKEVLLHGR